jgi:hypothetical protein
MRLQKRDDDLTSLCELSLEGCISGLLRFCFSNCSPVLLCSVLLCVVCIVLRMLEIEVRSEDGSRQLKLGELEKRERQYKMKSKME